MARKRLNLNPEELRLHKNEMHRKQMAIRKQKAERQALKCWVKSIFEIYENLGWDKTELLVGAEDDVIEKIVDKIIEDGRFKVVFGSKQLGIKQVKD